MTVTDASTQFRGRFATLLDHAPPEREVVEFEGRWTTWGTLQAVARSVDDALTARGLGAESRVGLILENRPEHVGVLLAILASGRTVVSFSGMQPPMRLAADIERSLVPVVIGTEGQLGGEGVRAAAGDALVLRLCSDRVESPGVIEPIDPQDDHLAAGIAIEMLTSGTTGPPKRVLLTERQFATALSTSAPLPENDALFRSGTTLVVTPMVHIGGFWGSLAPIYSGRKICLQSRFDVASWVAAVDRHRPRAVGLVPAALRAILEADVPAEALSSIQVVTSGTAHCPPEIIDAMLQRYGIRVLPTYGATEFAGAIALWTLPMHVEYWSSKRGAAGRAVRGIELRVTDADGVPVPTGEKGLLEVRGPQSVGGAQTWQRTSDLASLDEDGFLWIHGRADDAIVRGGFKVHPDTVRAALEKHPAVREAAVAPLPDPRLGAVPVAGVELVAGASAPTGEELRQHCRKHLLPYEVPAHVIVLSELPRTPSHKVSRVDLLEQVVAAVGAQA